MNGEEKGNPLDNSLNLKDALRTGEPDIVYQVLQNVNMALTGNTSAPAAEREIKDDIRDLFRSIKEGDPVEMKFYLGDGGYSRLFITLDQGSNIDDVDITLGERNASDKVKERWPDIKDKVSPPNPDKE